MIEREWREVGYTDDCRLRFIDERYHLRQREDGQGFSADPLLLEKARKKSRDDRVGLVPGWDAQDACGANLTIRIFFRGCEENLFNDLTRPLENESLGFF